MSTKKHSIPLVFAWLTMVGCTEKVPENLSSRSGTLPALVALGAKPGAAIVAQGQIEPAKGVLPIVAPPGDRVASIEVTEGQAIKVGDVLGRLEGQQVKELELEIAIAKRDETVAKLKAEEAAAAANLEVAKVGFEQAKLTVDQAVRNLEEAETDGGKLELLAQQLSIAEAKLTQLIAASKDRDTGRLITPSSIEQQQLLVDQSRSQLNMARREAQQRIAEGKLAVERAEKEIVANELAIAAAKSASGVQTLEKQIELLRLQLQNTRLTSPINGVVVSIDTKAGEPTTVVPIMRLADTSRMIARAEINVVDLQRVTIGSKATITSSALREPLQGKVKAISQLVGSPRLPNPNPMSRVDWRSAQVIISIETDSIEVAAERIQLQVDVAIEASPMKNSSI